MTAIRPGSGACWRRTSSPNSAGAHHYISNTPKDEDALDWLPLMRRYHAPARLLDFSKSPHVAACFATAEAARGQRHDLGSRRLSGRTSRCGSVEQTRSARGRRCDERGVSRQAAGNHGYTAVMPWNVHCQWNIGCRHRVWLRKGTLWAAEIFFGPAVENARRRTT